jgi:hypothetical protein
MFGYFYHEAVDYNDSCQLVLPYILLLLMQRMEKASMAKEVADGESPF